MRGRQPWIEEDDKGPGGSITGISNRWRGEWGKGLYLRRDEDEMKGYSRVQDQNSCPIIWSMRCENNIHLLRMYLISDGK